MGFFSSLISGISKFTSTKVADEMLDYETNPFHIPYEGIHREAYMSLRTELNEPFRFDCKKLNKDFGVNHSFSFFKEAAAVNIPCSLSSLTSKNLRGGYEFCANFTNPSLMLLGNSMLDGNVIVRMKHDFSNSLTMKANTEIINNQTMQTTFNFDYKRADYISQLQVGSNIPLIKASCSKSVTPELSLHGEVSWNGNVKNDVGFAARYATYEAETEIPERIVAGQVSTKCAIMSYFQKMSEKASFAIYLMYNYMSRNTRARVGCVYSVTRGRLLANIDSNGVFAAHFETRLVEGLNIILSTELDPEKRKGKAGCVIIMTS